MGHRVGLFNYATQQTGGHVDFDHFLLSDTLTSQNQPLDESDLDAAIEYAGTLDEGDYPAEAWATTQDALARRRSGEGRTSWARRTRSTHLNGRSATSSPAWEC